MTKKLSHSEHAFVLRLSLSIAAVILGAAAVKIVYISRALPTVEALAWSRAAFYAGLALIDGILVIGVWGVVRLQYRAAISSPLSVVARRLNRLQLARTEIIPVDDEAEWHESDIDAVTQATTTLMQRLRTLKHQLRDASQKILESSNAAFSTSKQQSTLIASQEQFANDMAAAIRELVTTVHQINENANAVVEVASRTLNLTEQGQQSVMDVVKSMGDIQRSSQVSSSRIMALSKQSSHINDVVRTIDRIIEETKLIAFNATIEAARAKEEGKGFGVVALEIKRLAEEVFESTEDIKEVIQDIQRVSHALVLATEDEMKTVARGTDLAQQAGVALQQIFDMVRLTTESAQRIAAAMQQQQETSEHAFQSVEVVNQSFAKFSQEAKQFAVTTAELTFLAEGLGKIISGFDMAAQKESRT